MYVYRLLGPEKAPEELAEHFEPAGFKLPIHIMIVDQAGEAARVVITVDGMTFH